MAVAVACGAAAVFGAVACQPVEGDLNPSTVSATTDQQGTAELNRQHAQVAWLSCSGAYVNRTTGSGATTQEVHVDCRGETKEGKAVTLSGDVYGVVSGKCVRGSLTAKVDGKVWFHLGVLGNCAAPDTTTPPPPSQGGTPTTTPQPQQPGETQTVTETVTVRAPSSTCTTFQGK
ncbi:hypothetical protein [Streptomyces sp. VRA16 Mangrove soil]|uniref:hypothetical protein n=1 Tax=Streptomyces sp. VRA16 Mangrove soil TaxID=2817434 RepID=UPI0027DD6AC7|nr:hypothetical protein [Streptomyces sp. VRA16 Mangrove soil]